MALPREAHGSGKAGLWGVRRVWLGASGNRPHSSNWLPLSLTHPILCILANILFSYLSLPAASFSPFLQVLKLLSSHTHQPTTGPWKPSSTLGKFSWRSAAGWGAPWAAGSSRNSSTSGGHMTLGQGAAKGRAVGQRPSLPWGLLFPPASARHGHSSLVLESPHSHFRGALCQPSAWSTVSRSLRTVRCGQL